MTAPETYDDGESYESYEEFEFASEAAIRDHRRPSPRIFVPGGVSSATLNTPKGPAKLNLPSAVPTLKQYRALEQTVNATNARLTAATADLARMRQELALQRRNQAGQGGGMMSMMLPLLMQKQQRDDLEGHTHVGSSAAAVVSGGGSLSTMLPFLFMQPNMFGQSGSGMSASGGQDSMSQMMMMFVMMELFDRGA